MADANKCSINIVTGFLGSGKTTLLGDVLSDAAYAGTSVIINEYGEAGLDHRLIRRIEERTTLLAGGCVCCNRREDLITELNDMLNAHQSGKLPLDRVVIETTGLADPAPILFSILTHPILIHHYRVETVTACLDAVNGETHLTGNPESVKQIAAADKVIITKTDISTPEKVKRLRSRVARINPTAQILKSIRGHIPASVLWNTRPSMPPRPVILPNLLLNETNSDGHATSIRSMSLQFTEPLDWLAFGIWLSMLLQKHGEKMFRVKGIVDVGEGGPIVLNGVQHIIHPPRHLEDWKGYETRASQIVFIMRDIEPGQIMESLFAFQSLIGAKPEISEINMNPFV
ncbi:ATP-binding protein [Synergistales bacterium]|nr:ATP-binding protein [Synergistales bacterium]GHV58078.1 ATP-binding protein [Synergistales bacterium]